MSTASFEASAQRHLSDAGFLFADSRLPNADHLCGFSAECSLKALVVEGLNGREQGGYVYASNSTQRMKLHLGGTNSAWSAIAALAGGRQEPEVMALLTDDPFDDWDVSDRYSDGAHITVPTVQRHLEGAERAARALEAVRISNMSGAI